MEEITHNKFQTGKDILLLAYVFDPIACLIIDNKLIGYHYWGDENTAIGGIANLLLEFYQGYKDTPIFTEEMKNLLENEQFESFIKNEKKNVIVGCYDPEANEYGLGISWKMKIMKDIPHHVRFYEFQIEMGEPLSNIVEMSPEEAFLIIGNILVSKHKLLLEQIYPGKDKNRLNTERLTGDLLSFYKKNFPQYEKLNPLQIFPILYLNLIRKRIEERELSVTQIMKTGGISVLVMLRDMIEVKEHISSAISLLKGSVHQLTVPDTQIIANSLLLIELKGFLDELDLPQITVNEMDKINSEVIKKLNKPFPPAGDRWFSIFN